MSRPSLAAAVLPAYPWGALARASLRLWWLKTLGTTGFITLFFMAYLELLYRPWFPVSEIPHTAVDHWIGFNPAALPLYLSLWVYVSLPTVLLFTARELFDFGRAALLVCLIGLGCFLLWPTAVPPAHIDWAAYPGFAFLKGVDASGNACPSLHVATAVFAGCWMEAVLRRVAAARYLSWLNVVWCVGIVYSTLATKQHVFLDVLAGSALGLLVGLGSVWRLRLDPFTPLQPAPASLPLRAAEESC